MRSIDVKGWEVECGNSLEARHFRDLRSGAYWESSRGFLLLKNISMGFTRGVELTG